MTGSISEVIVRMRDIEESTDPRDGVRWFNWVYRLTTERIQERLRDGFFADARFTEHLDVVFADRYFAAVDDAAAGRRVDAAWRPLFKQRADRRVHAAQFVVAGMNAHINHDLALAVVDTCAAEHTAPGEGSVAYDFRRVNEVLEELEAEIRRTLLADLERELGDRLGPFVHLLSSWSIGQAREAAWVRAEVLWRLRDEPPLYRELAAVSAKAAGMTSRHLLVPLLPAETVVAITQ
jgi:hypothetical protein